MAKVCKLKRYMRAAKTQISIRGNRVYKGLHSPIMKILAFFLQSFTKISFNQTKYFMVMMASFMDLHGIQNLCLHCPIIHKSCLCLQDTQRKRAMIYTISRPIF